MNKSSVRSKAEIDLMRQSGSICAKALLKVLDHVAVGVSTRELDEIAEAEIKRLGGEISFQTVEDYPNTICVSVDDEVVHGLPTKYQLQYGDVLGIDIGALYQGWHSDLAETVLVQKGTDTKGGSIPQSTIDFLATGKKALRAAIARAKDGNRVGDISDAMQTIVEGAGYSCVRALTGHGVGRNLHEDPAIPCFGKPGKGEELKAGMTVAIEVIYNMGKADVAWKNNDGWTIATADGSLSGLFERTILITKGTAEILTPID